MGEKLANFKALVWEKKIYFLAGVFIFFIFLSLSFLLFKAPKPAPISPKSLSPAPTASEREGIMPPLEEKSQEEEKREALLPLPKVYFENYQNQASLPQVPQTLKSYSFRGNFPLAEALSLGAKLGLLSYKYNDGYVVVYNAKEPEKAGLLVFDRKTGGFTFNSFGKHQLQTSNFQTGLLTLTQLQTSTQTFLEELGIIDGTVECQLTYQKKDSPGVTFVECHRAWAKTGLPILNFLGILNLPENKSLANLAVGEEVVGEARADDFNTITVGVSSSGSIVSLDSHMRQIIADSSISSQQLLTPQEALAQFSSHQAQTSLTIPAGEGFADFARIYPNNLAYAQEAVISDYLLTFLELPFPLGMEDLVPMYLIRGTAVLASGYRVRFAETVPALRSGLSSLPIERATAKVATANRGQVAAESIKLGTFTPTPAPPTAPPTTTPKPPTITPPSYTPPTDTDTPPPSIWCEPTEDQLNPTYDLGVNLGMIGLYTHQGPRRLMFYYYVPPEGERLSASHLSEVLAAFERLNLSEGITQLRAPNEIFEDWNPRRRCPLRMTGGSPTIFVYGEPGTSLTVEVGRNVTYTDPPSLPLGATQGQGPAVMGGVWEVRVGEESEGERLMINGVSRNYIYYEYEPLTFEKPDKGWVVEMERLKQWVRDFLSPSLGLRDLEEERLVFEFEHAAFDIDAEYVFVGLIPQEEVEKKLPLEVTPKPDKVARLHFYLAAASEDEKARQGRATTKIPRRGFMLLELGAVKGQ